MTEQGLELILANEQYGAALLHKCFYWYTREFRLVIEPASAGYTRVWLQAKEGQVLPPLLEDQVHNDLVDFKLRELIAEETQTVRELLMAKAFAHYDTSQPLAERISDPVGFHPLGQQA